MRLFQILSTMVLTMCVGLGATPLTYATVTDPLTTIELDTPVHFLAPDGSPLVTESTTFTVEAAEEWIRLVPDERHNALLLEAKKGKHELDLSDALALSVAGTEDEHKDLHHIILLLPDGQSLESMGTYSGIRPRGLFDNVVKKRQETR